MTSPTHKRTRIFFDELLANTVKKNTTGKKGSGRLLSLDGGGIKGLVLTRMLLSMEKEFETPIVHCFDWIAGTSTGAILALALATGKSTLECQALYFRLKDKVFVDSKPYGTKPLEELLQAEFGLTKMKDIENPKMVITATMADRTPPDLQLFRNYQSPMDMVGVSEYDHPDLSRQNSPIRTSDTLVCISLYVTGLHFSILTFHYFFYSVFFFVINCLVLVIYPQHCVKIIFDLSCLDKSYFKLGTYITEIF